MCLEDGGLSMSPSIDQLSMHQHRPSVDQISMQQSQRDSSSPSLKVIYIRMIRLADKTHSDGNEM